MSIENRIEEENAPEENPTKEQVLEVMGITLENYEVREKSDEQGLYHLEVKIEKENGEYQVYGYVRRGEFDTHKSSGTSVYVAEYDKDGDFLKYPEHIAEFSHETGQWNKV